MRGRYQGGSLASFIIIAVVLALVLVGGLYGLNRYNAHKAASEASQGDDSGDLASDNGDSQTKTDSDKTNSAQTKTDDSQAKTDSSSSADSSNAQPSPQPSSSTSSSLPQTGPADSLLMLLAVTALTFAGTHYLRSRA